MELTVVYKDIVQMIGQCWKHQVKRHFFSFNTGKKVLRLVGHEMIDAHDVWW